MRAISQQKAKWKVIFSVVWLVFTFSLIFWWWIYSLKSMGSVPEDRTHRMFFWEGLSLLLVIFMGGVGLIFLTFKDQKRHERMKLFFSSFSHDIKTSLTRIRLQAEVLAETEKVADLGRLLPDIHRLELSLENSLAVANLEDLRFKLEDFPLSRVLGELREEFSDLKISLNKDLIINSDLRMFVLILKNIFSNSRLHGQATKMSIQVEEQEIDRVHILLTDNGSGSEVSQQRGSGLGLYLSGRILAKLNGQLKVRQLAHDLVRHPVHSHEKDNAGYTVELILSKKGRS